MFNEVRVVKYSPRAAQALAFLKRPYNDIDIFVEDTGNHNMWLLLLREILPVKVRLFSVNLLGGRERVDEACRLDQADDGRKKLYIIDGDFDFLNNVRKSRLKHLYRLRAYCIENLIIHEHALVQAALPMQPNMTERQVQRSLDYSTWINDVSLKLSPLFVMYATVKRVMPQVQTVGYSVLSLINDTPAGPLLSTAKIQRRIRGLYKALRSKYSLAQIRAFVRFTTSNAKNIGFDRGISGKDYILPLVWLKIKKLFGYRGTLEQLKVLLSQFWYAGREAYFERRLIRALW